jgi:predicted Rossmann-fold nucleotide-binding protein
LCNRFGSARFELNNTLQNAERIGAEIAKLGFTVMTGGGPGIMEAANKGTEAGGIIVGSTLFYWNKSQSIFAQMDLHSLFFVRKVNFKYSYGLLVFSLGRWVLDELFEALT